MTPTHYLHNGKLYGPLDRMPPDESDYTVDFDGIDEFERDATAFAAYLSTLHPIPHELKGEGIQVEGKDFEWRYEWYDGCRWRLAHKIEIDGNIYTDWRKVAVPIEAKEQAAPQQQAGRELMELIDRSGYYQYKDKWTWEGCLPGQELSTVDMLKAIIEPLLPPSVSNPVAFAEWLGVEGWRAYASDPKYYRKDGESPKTPADLYALFTSQHGEQETQAVINAKLESEMIDILYDCNGTGAGAEDILNHLKQHYHITPKNKQ